MNKLLVPIIACITIINGQNVSAQTDCGLHTVIISEDKPLDWNFPEVIVFQDSFNLTSLDQNLWGFGFPWGKMLNNEALEGMAEENLEITNGELIIKTEHRPREFDRFIFNDQGELTGTEPVLRNYSSAGIFSRIEFTKGEFEMDYSIEEITAQWPAFWLLGDCQQELDIFEYFYGKSIFHNNWTKEITYTLHQDYNCNDPDKCMLVKTKNLDDGFHNEQIRSKLSWETSQLKFYNNSEDPDFVHYRWRDFSYRAIAYPGKGDILYQSSFFPFDRPMRLLVGQGVHKNIDNKIIGKPRYFKVDNVTVWQKLDPSGKYRLSKEYPYDESYDGIITGAEVSVSDRSSFSYKPYLIIRVIDNVTLNPGFDSNNNLVDIKVVVENELRYQPESEALKLTPHLIKRLDFYNFQGDLCLSLQSLNHPIHEKDNLIRGALNGTNELNGLFILRISYSDGSTEIEKLGFF